MMICCLVLNKLGFNVTDDESMTVWMLRVIKKGKKIENFEYQGLGEIA